MSQRTFTILQDTLVALILVGGLMGVWFYNAPAETCTTDTECMHMHGGDGYGGES